MTKKWIRINLKGNDVENGKIILLGAPFMIIYTSLAAIIRADGSPKYSMACLLVGAILNIVLDPIFIFGLKMGVVGGAVATIIGQIVSAIMTIYYIPKVKSVKLKKGDFIPISLILTHFIGLYGALYAGPMADTICFIAVIFIFGSEYKKIGKKSVESHTLIDDISTDNILNKKVIITISREYGSGGRYIGRLLADKLGIKFYDKDLVLLVSKEAGLSEDFIEANEQKRQWGSSLNPYYNNDDKLFAAESKAIKEIAEKESCVIIGRCADYILKDEENIVKIFIYSNENDKIHRAVKYYNIDEKSASKEINKVNKERAKHYKYYTNQDWGKAENYDFAFNSDYLGVNETSEMIKEIILKKYWQNRK